MQRKITYRILHISLWMVAVCGFFTVHAQLNELPHVPPFAYNPKQDSINKVLYDFAPDFSDYVIKARLKKIEKGVNLTFNKKVRSFIDYFTIRNREYSRMVIRRQYLYFPIFEEYLKKYDLPDELKYLSIVESGLNPKVRSRTGAVGLWQFMGPTGEHYGLNSDDYIDERMNIRKSTESACKYLKSLYNTFGDWQLALAAYNCGPGNIRKAQRRAGRGSDFWEAYKYLPAETRSYVPQFIAVTYLMNYYTAHNIHPEYYEFHPETDTIHIERPIDLEVLCKHINFCAEDLNRLNPELRQHKIVKKECYMLHVPSDLAIYIRENRKALLDSAALTFSQVAQTTAPVPAVTNHETASLRKTKYKVKSGESLISIAKKHYVVLADLKRWNSLKSNNIHKGQVLVLYKKFTPKTSSSSGLYAAKFSGKKSTYKVQPGDTLWT
ncbi:MAG: transglycosylase SLT domain-containing protein, partial [Cytophagales bacterium]|nr:transglycosylase SLT domain-containing protein [Cytophagales bacterium]